MRLILRNAGLAIVSLALLIALAPALAFAADPDGDDDDDDKKPAVSEVVVTAHRLDTARASIDPGLGASTYTLTNDAVERLPGGETISLSQVLLQFPGVSQGGLGQIHIRQDRGDLQYRINNVILPEGLSEFGQVLSPRLADRIELITGALPAQYGLHGGGVINITTKSGVYLNGGQAEIYGGSHSEIEPAFEYGGSANGTNFFVSGSYLQNNLGVASPDGGADPLHDRTEQFQAFAFIDHIIGAKDRVSLMLGSSDERFQIPDQRGLNALTYRGGSAAFQRPLVVYGVSSFPSEQLNESQRENTQFAILSYLHTTERATLQVSAFARYSDLSFHPDAVGDILYSGVSQRLTKSDLTAGLQVEGVYNWSADHTLRAGAVLSAQRTKNETRSAVLAIDAQGRQRTDIPSTLTNRSSENGSQASLFAQDEWKPLAPLTINFGLRLDHVDAVRQQTALSPRVSAVWTTATGTTLHAAYARYFIPAPTDGDAGVGALALVGTTGAPPTFQNDPARSETDNYYDVGVQQKFGGLTFGIDGYWRGAKNLIDDGQFGAPIIRTAYNYRNGHIQGVEFSTTYTEGPFSAWSNLAIAQARGRGIVSNQFNFTQAHLTFAGGHYIGLDQDQTYTASGGAAYRWGPLQVSSDLIYGSGLRTTPLGGSPNGARLPGYVQVNLASVYHLRRSDHQVLDIRFDVINAFDEHYEIRDGRGLGAGPALWGPGRGFFVGLEQTF